MKKLLLATMAALSLSVTQKANAQLALENFDHAGALPTGWIMINDGHTVSTSFTTATWLQDSLNNHAWFPVQVVASGNYSMITTSKFATAAAANRWLISPSFTVSSANTVLKWDDYDLGSGESLEIKVSPTAGTTAAAFTDGVYSAVAGSGGMVTHQLPIGQYNGQTIRIAFRDTTNNNWGLVVDNVSTAILPTLDLGVTSLNLNPFVQTGSNNSIAGALHNYGYSTLTSCNINYNVNGGAVATTALSSLNVTCGSNYNYTSTTNWTPSSAGTYTIKVWADQINGSTGVDQNHANDTLTFSILVIDQLQPKTVMIEEFTQASCDPCANAHVNVDTVFANNISRAEICRYHVNFPGRDCMDSVTLSPFVQSRLTYYSVSGVPDAKVDGYDVYPGAGYLTSAVIGGEASIGSPFTITINNPSYNAATQSFSYSADIKAFGAIPAGLKAYAVLVVDTLTYHANQSTESIPQTIFPQVAENMFPASGTGLSAFTANSTQTINGSWVKNHPWGSNRSVWGYDSTLTGRIIIWIENDANKFVYQAAGAPITTGVVGVNAVVGNQGSLDVYPNPAKNAAVVGLNLLSDQDVKLEVYNMLGQMVYEMASEHRNAGNSVSTINTANLANGQYMVKVIVGGEILTKQLVIAK